MELAISVVIAGWIAKDIRKAHHTIGKSIHKDKKIAKNFIQHKRQQSLICTTSLAVAVSNTTAFTFRTLAFTAFALFLTSTCFNNWYQGSKSLTPFRKISFVCN